MVHYVVHSLIGELLAPCRYKLSGRTCSDLVPLERSGLVLALEMEMCVWCACSVLVRVVVSLVLVSVSVSVSLWCGVVWLLSWLGC